MEVTRKIEHPMVSILSLKECAYLWTALVLARSAHYPILPTVCTDDVAAEIGSMECLG